MWLYFWFFTSILFYILPVSDFDRCKWAGSCYCCDHAYYNAQWHGVATALSQDLHESAESRLGTAKGKRICSRSEEHHELDLQ